MPKVLIYDTDRGLASVGSDERIEQVFGYRPRRFIRTQSVFDLFDKLHKPKIIKTEDPLGVVEEEYYSVRDEFDIDLEVLDSLSAFQTQKKREIQDGKKMTLPNWAELGDAIEELAFKLTRVDRPVIIVGHVKETKDDDLGIIRYVPALSGRMQVELSRVFDLVLYTIVTKDDKNGERQFLWQVLPDERRDAKSRYEEVSKFAEKHGGYMPQDFHLLFNLIKDGGHKNPKILIIGNSGSGKTYSLRTLKNVNLKEKGE